MRRRQRGLTLVELLGALALSAVLVAATLQSLTHLTRMERRLTARDAGAAEAAALRELLGRDLAMAGQVRFADGVLRLQAPRALDARSGREGALRARIEYRLRSVEGRPWLLRRQEVLVEGPLGGASDEWVGCDLALVAVEPLQAATGPATGPATPPATRPATAGPAEPGAWRVEVTVAGRTEVWTIAVR